MYLAPPSCHFWFHKTRGLRPICQTQGLKTIVNGDFVLQINTLILYILNYLCPYFLRNCAREGSQIRQQAGVHLHHETQPSAPSLVRPTTDATRRWQPSVILFVKMLEDVVEIPLCS